MDIGGCLLPVPRECSVRGAWAGTPYYAPKPLGAYLPRDLAPRGSYPPRYVTLSSLSWIPRGGSLVGQVPRGCAVRRTVRPSVP